MLFSTVILAVATQFDFAHVLFTVISSVYLSEGSLFSDYKLHWFGLLSLSPSTQAFRAKAHCIQGREQRAHYFH